MNREEVLQVLQSDKKYLQWSELNKYAEENKFKITYGNKYISWLKISETEAICIECKNVYGSQMILRFS